MNLDINKQSGRTWFKPEVLPLLLDATHGGTSQVFEDSNGYHS